MGFFAKFVPSLYEIPSDLIDMSAKLAAECTENSPEKKLAEDIRNLLVLLKDNNNTADIVCNGAKIKEMGKSIIQRIDNLKVTAKSKNDIERLANFILDISKMHGQDKYKGKVFEKDELTVNLPVIGEKTVDLKAIALMFYGKINEKIARYDEVMNLSSSSSYVEPIEQTNSSSYVAQNEISSNSGVYFEENSEDQSDYENSEQEELQSNSQPNSFSEDVPTELYQCPTESKKTWLSSFKSNLRNIKDKAAKEVAKLSDFDLANRFMNIFSVLGDSIDKMDKSPVSKNNKSQSASSSTVPEKKETSYQVNDSKRPKKETSRKGKLKRRLTRSGGSKVCEVIDLPDDLPQLNSNNLSTTTDSSTAKSTASGPSPVVQLEPINVTRVAKTELEDIKSQLENTVMKRFDTHLGDVLILGEKTDTDEIELNMMKFGTNSALSRKDDLGNVSSPESHDPITEKEPERKTATNPYRFSAQPENRAENANNKASKSASASNEQKSGSWQMPNWAFWLCVAAIPIGIGALVLIVYGIYKLCADNCCTSVDVVEPRI